MQRNKLITYLDNYLHLADIKDYGPQGLQVETANETINRIALAVDTAPPVIRAAADWQADMLIVHHGILWRFEAYSMFPGDTLLGFHAVANQVRPILTS